MTEGSPANLAASVHAQLLDQARADGRPFNELLQLYATERFLYRLSKSPHAESFVLRGALRLRVWDRDSHRATRDIDLMGRMKKRDVESVLKVIRSVCATDVEPDGLVFDRRGLAGEAIVEEADDEGVRVTFSGHLGNAQIPMQIDLGFGNIIVGGSPTVEFPTLLGMPAPRLAMYSAESTIAEKVQVMLQRGQANSRMKDFYDLWWLARNRAFKGKTLALAIRLTCQHRGTPVPTRPAALTAEFGALREKRAQWNAFRDRLGPTECPRELGALIGALATFLCPVTGAIARGEPFEAAWDSPGPWR